MVKENGSTQAAEYIIRVKNHLDAPYWQTWFDGMTITHTEGGETVLSGSVVDQCALHGLLEKIRSLNLTLVSVLRVDPDRDNA